MRVAAAATGNWMTRFPGSSLPFFFCPAFRPRERAQTETIVYVILHNLSDIYNADAIHTVDIRVDLAREFSLWKLVSRARAHFIFMIV